MMVATCFGRRQPQNGMSCWRRPSFKRVKWLSHVGYSSIWGSLNDRNTCMPALATQGYSLVQLFQASVVFAQIPVRQHKPLLHALLLHAQSFCLQVVCACLSCVLASCCLSRATECISTSQVFVCMAETQTQRCKCIGMLFWSPSYVGCCVLCGGC